MQANLIFVLWVITNGSRIHSVGCYLDLPAFLSLATVWLNLEAINPLSFDNAQVDDMPLAVGNDWAYFHVD